jgi:outer membrane biosynthesis protein TonB
MPSSIQDHTRPAAHAFAIAVLLTFNLLPALPAPAQTSSSGATVGRLFVPGNVMDGNCTTRVSPRYPSGTANPKPATITLRVVIGKSGAVSPMYRISGPPELEAEAMDAVRLWTCKPYMRGKGPDAVPIDVLTDLKATFTPGQPPGTITHLPQ